MKRFHVHIAVDDVAANVEFYSKLFGQPPAKERSDYAKWMLDDPRVNFAISSQRRDGPQSLRDAMRAATSTGPSIRRASRGSTS